MKNKKNIWILLAPLLIIAISFIHDGIMGSKMLCSYADSKQKIYDYGCIELDHIYKRAQFNYELLERNKDALKITFNEKTGEPDTYLLDAYILLMPETKENIEFAATEYKKCLHLSYSCVDNYTGLYWYKEWASSKRNKISNDSINKIREAYKIYFQHHKIYKQTSVCMTSLEYSQYTEFVEIFKLKNEYAEIEKKFTEDHWNGKEWLEKCKY